MNTYSPLQDDGSSGFSFTFDSNLSLTEDKVVGLDEAKSSLAAQTVVMQAPPSPATDDLDQKIAKAKNIWESYQPDAPIYEHP